MTHPLPDVELPSGSAPGPLDNPVWASLTGAHAHLAEGTAEGPAAALRYPADMSPFAAVPVLDSQGWAALRRLATPGGVLALALPRSTDQHPLADWEVRFRIPGVQMVATPSLRAEPDAEAVVLGADDAGEMLALARRTEPGPFEARTNRLGTYLGLRRDGALVAMAGERMHPPGWTEISAVCTDPAFRGRGVAGRLVRAVAHGIIERGETPFLHTAASNVNALRLYEALGFAVHRRVEFLALRLRD